MRLIEEIKMGRNIDMSEKYLQHHGRLGQRWGVRNGPPYPLDQGTVSSAYGSGVKKYESNGKENKTENEKATDDSNKIKKLDSLDLLVSGDEAAKRRPKAQLDRIADFGLKALDKMDGTTNFIDTPKEELPGLRKWFMNQRGGYLLIADLALRGHSQEQIEEVFDVVSDADFDLLPDTYQDLANVLIEHKGLNTQKKYAKACTEMYNQAKQFADDLLFNSEGTHLTDYGKDTDENVKAFIDEIIDGYVEFGESETSEYLQHRGRSKRDGAAVGSGRWPLGSGKNPYQHGTGPNQAGNTRKYAGNGYAQLYEPYPPGYNSKGGNQVAEVKRKAEKAADIYNKTVNKILFSPVSGLGQVVNKINIARAEKNNPKQSNDLGRISNKITDASLTGNISDIPSKAELEKAIALDSSPRSVPKKILDKITKKTPLSSLEIDEMIGFKFAESTYLTKIDKLYDKLERRIIDDSKNDVIGKRRNEYLSSIKNKYEKRYSKMLLTELGYKDKTYDVDLMAKKYFGEKVEQLYNALKEDYRL